MPSLETAINKCTAAPADIMRIKRRGRLEKGCYADIVIFAYDRLGTDANFYTPRVYPTGIETVVINGKAVLLDGANLENVLAGEVLKSNQN